METDMNKTLLMIQQLCMDTYNRCKEQNIPEDGINIWSDACVLIEIVKHLKSPIMKSCIFDLIVILTADIESYINISKNLLLIKIEILSKIATKEGRVKLNEERGVKLDEEES